MRGWEEPRKRMRINRRRMRGDTDGGVSRRCKARARQHDIPLRDAIAKGKLAGPEDSYGGRATIRARRRKRGRRMRYGAFVRKQKSAART